MKVKAKASIAVSKTLGRFLELGALYNWASRKSLTETRVY